MSDPQAPLPPLPVSPNPAKKGLSGCQWALIIVPIVALVGIFFVSILAGIALGPIMSGIKKAKENSEMQQARAIALAMFQYAADNNGTYPDGNTSTEVFQKLLDGKYVEDPAIFYFAMDGKTKPASNTLTAQNVCFDVTSGIASDSHDTVPVVFSTGYTMVYTSPLTATRTAGAPSSFQGIAVAFKNNSARFCKADSTGNVTDISSDFSADANTYKQLTP